MSAPRQVTLARLAELGLRPDRELGQHFLVDDNLLGVIERLAALEPERRRARDRRGRRHADGAPGGDLRARARGRDRPPPRDGAAAHARGHRQRDGALGRCDAPDLDGFEPRGDGVRRQPAVPRRGAARARLDRRAARRASAGACSCSARSRERLDGRRPGTRSTAGRACSARSRSSRTGRHAVSRSVFVPVPNVDSTLVAFARRPEWAGLAGDWPAIVATVRAAFAYRRKTHRERARAGRLARRPRAPSRRPAHAPASTPARAPRRCPAEAFARLARAGA